MDENAENGDSVAQSHLAQVAHNHWLGKAPATRVQSSVIKADLWDYLDKAKFDLALVHELESLQCFELYLWPAWSDDASHYHAILAALLLNAKRREGLPNWGSLVDLPEQLASFFKRLRALILDNDYSTTIRTHLLTCITGAFQSLDIGLIRKECAPLVAVGIWSHLHSEQARSELLEAHPQFKKAWRAASKRYDAADDMAKARLRQERSWLYSLLLDFLNLLYTPSRHDTEGLLYCERFLEFLTDLLSQFPTRRYSNTLFKDMNLLVAIKHSAFYSSADEGVLQGYWELLRHHTYFPIDDTTGQQLSAEQVDEINSARITSLQTIAYKHFKDDLYLLALTHHGAVSRRAELLSYLEPLSDEALTRLSSLLGYRTTYPTSTSITVDRAFLLELFAFSYERRPSLQESIKSMPVMPTEQILYDPAILRNEVYDGTRPLAIPKLNLQYLTTTDFLWRSFILSRCEAFYEIRTDLQDTIKRIQPRGRDRPVSTRMALRISKPAIVSVIPPKVGQFVPAEVRAEIILDVSRMPDDVRRDWDELRADDVVFLLAIKPQKDSRPTTNGQVEEPSLQSAPYSSLRAAEVLQVLDENSKPLRQGDQQGQYTQRRPKQRRLIVNIDATAYAKDIKNKAKGQPDIYESLNLVVRRRSRENNFKSVLESIRSLALSNTPLPSWLQDVFLGMGDPSSASFRQLTSAFAALDFRDTFVDWQHVRDSFATKDVTTEGDDDDLNKPPYVVEFPRGVKDAEQPSGPKKRRQNEAGASRDINGQDADDGGRGLADRTKDKSKKRRREDVEKEEAEAVETVKVSTYKPPNQGPYPTDKPALNQVRFTPTQIEAITSGTQPGLTVIVGPPGTGKTDVATQIINNIYHNFPSERILLVTHSNQALNQLFEKIAALDIDQRHLLRLGQGERDLQVDSGGSYSRHGRVEYFLERGRHLLSEVGRLAASIEVMGGHANSCETAEYFNTVYIQPIWRAYVDEAATTEDVSDIAQKFPFHIFFANAPQPLFADDMDRQSVLDIAKGCYRHIENIFIELGDIRPFEVLRRDREKNNYLLVKEARIIAMTSTHAAMRRQEIVKLGFQYDSLVMEEAAQVSEVDNFIPMALQKTPIDSRESRLKRVVLCGDHLQNSPIVQNQAMRQYANLEQSLFLRLIRLGVPHIQLDAQGRARSSLASLYSSRYPKLLDLPHVQSLPEFTRANAGLRWAFQFIDVPDYKGRGETQPTPHFIQNLGEAEYVVAMYQYMRLLGYPARKITILTMYAGQRALIRDVLGHRCAKNRLFGLPRAVITVDKYQGEQNDYVLLSLVRTRSAGYMRDARRMTVALSRARLGLYMFGRRSVFEGNAELFSSLEQLLKRPEKLQIVQNEMFPAERGVESEIESTDMEGLEHLGQYVYEMTKAKVQALRENGGSLPEVEEGEAVDDEEDGPLVEEEEPDSDEDAPMDGPAGVGVGGDDGEPHE